MSEAIKPLSYKPNAKLKFNGSDAFLRVLRQRVDQYFETTGKKRRDVPQMYLKTATILTFFFACYFVLLFASHSWMTAIPLSIGLGLGLAGIGFNIQHDGGHKAYSDRPWVNSLMAKTIDMVGGSSYLWDWKHNTIHHTYTNISGHDDDIDVGALARLSPHQPHHWWHRAQGIYLWVLYGFLAVKWHWYDDFYCVAIGRIGGFKIKRPKGKDLAVFIGGKALFFSLAIVIPLFFHHWYNVVSCYLLAACVSGVTMSVVFQLAHCVQEAEFPLAIEVSVGHEKIENEWAIHQVQTTVDFARRNPFLAWALGGLNYQVEHHLFSRICHIHYPALSKLVEETCKECGIQYNAHKTMLAAIGSHYMQLVEMGRPTTA